jgi:hypothetical protein
MERSCSLGRREPARPTSCSLEETEVTCARKLVGGVRQALSKLS